MFPEEGEALVPMFTEDDIIIIIIIIIILLLLLLLPLLLRWHYSPMWALAPYCTSPRELCFWPLFPISYFVFNNICLYTIPSSVVWSSS